jgi:hypothetical protein
MKKIYLCVGAVVIILLGVFFIYPQFFFSRNTTHLSVGKASPVKTDPKKAIMENALIGTWQLFDTTDPENAKLVKYFNTYYANGTYSNEGGGGEKGVWRLVAKKDTNGTLSSLAPDEILLEEKSDLPNSNYWSLDLDVDHLTLWEVNENGRGQHVSFVKVKN